MKLFKLLEEQLERILSSSQDDSTFTDRLYLRIRVLRLHSLNCNWCEKKILLPAFLLCLSQAEIIYTVNHELAGLFELFSDVLQ